ncbi:MAG: hypothetical protein QXG05_02110 [Nitrososphaerota archaeon]
MNRLQLVAVILFILLAGVALPVYFAGYHSFFSRAESSNLSIKTTKLGTGKAGSLFENVTTRMVYKKGKTYLQAEGELVSLADQAPIANATVYMTCSTNLSSCGSSYSTTGANGAFNILLQTSLGCGQQVYVELSWPGTGYYAPYGNNYLVSNACPAQPLA